MCIRDSFNPAEGMQAEIDEKEKKKLEKYKASLSEEEKNKIVEETKNLLKHQSAEDDLSVMPYLLIDDIDKKADIIESRDEDSVFYVPAETNDVIYSELSLDVYKRQLIDSIL